MKIMDNPQATIVWGYYTYPLEGGPPEYTRFGEVTVPMPGAVSALKATATRLVKQSGDLHRLFLKYIASCDLRRRSGLPNAEDALFGNPNNAAQIAENGI